MDWQPIDTAPKDGTRIVASRGGFDICIVSWDSQKDFRKPNPYWADDRVFLGVLYCRGNPPIVWMPLEPAGV